MSTLHTALTTWEEFLRLPDAEDAVHYELHDGEVVAVPPAKPIHIFIQNFLAHWLTAATTGQGSAAQEFPYRPASNLQFWYADVAYLPDEDWKAMRRPGISGLRPAALDRGAFAFEPTSEDPAPACGGFFQRNARIPGGGPRRAND